MPYSNEIGVLSVLDPRRPENNRSDSATGSYTYRPRERNTRVPKVSFSLGWELEANHKPRRYPNGVELISDGSVNGDSAEFIVLPSLVKSPKFVLGLLKDLVHAPEMNTDKSCGFHIHLSPRGKSLETMRKWALACETLALAVEFEAFAAVPDARQSNSYCRRITPLEIGTRFQSSKYGNDRRYHWLNTVEMFRPGGIRTVEVRLLGNTHRWKYLLSWATFCLALAHGAWKLVYKPESKEAIVSKLLKQLALIKDEIKPLDKRGEPIPQQVYDDLKTIGIDYTVWERPLAKLSAAEHDVKGLRKVWYSDAQPTIEERRREDEEEDNSCSCGCGSEFSCSQQEHDDGNCDHNECAICHDEGNCGSAPDCYQCRDVRHDSGEYCGSVRCSTCRTANRIPTGTPLELPLTEASELLRGATLTRVTYDETASVADMLTAGEAIASANREALVNY
jgi:hypothetical protein